MTVKVRRRIEAMSTEFEATLYLPEDVPLTKERREKADKLDMKLKAEAEKINTEYDDLARNIKKSEIGKWRWLGQKIAQILESIPSIEQDDIDNNRIWPAIGQHMRAELSRGLDDKKRSGTRNDHYRKCWALHTLPGTEWITSWAGWDAFTDRGEQLAYDKKLLQLLGERFSRFKDRLSSNDFKEIAQLAVQYIPTKAKNPMVIDSMPETKLVEIADIIYEDFSKSRRVWLSLRASKADENAV